MCSKNKSRIFYRKGFFQKSTVADFHCLVASLMIPTSKVANVTSIHLVYYIRSLIKFSEVFKMVPLFYCKKLLILILEKFPSFTGDVRNCWFFNRCVFFE